MFLHLSVSHSVHRGVSASVHSGIHSPPRSRHPLGADTPTPQQTPPVQCMLTDTGNKRVVGILLECILVFRGGSRIFRRGAPKRGGGATIIRLKFSKDSMKIVRNLGRKGAHIIAPPTSANVLIAIVMSIWMLFPLVLPVVDPERMRCKNVVSRKFHLFS